MHRSNIFGALLAYEALSCYLYSVMDAGPYLTIVKGIEDLSEKFQDWYHKMFVSNPNFTLRLSACKEFP